MSDASDRYYGDAAYWNRRHSLAVRTDARRVHFCNWLEPFMPWLRDRHVRTLLDLGCGRGFDCLELAQRGLAVTGIDYSEVCLEGARALARHAGLDITFERADMAKPLAFGDSSFDATLSSLALHMFPDPVVREIMAQIRRCLVDGGLLLLNVNSTDDMPHRLRAQPPIERLAQDFYILEGGQTVHFFSREYCLELLSDWTILLFEQRRAYREDGSLSKIAWQIAAHI